MTDIQKQIILLKVRSLIADKDFFVSLAFRDIELGGWRCDYDQMRGQIDVEINDLLAKLEAAKC